MPIPDFQHWLFGQSHRDDMVGTMARLSVSQSQKIGQIGFERWLTELVDGVVMKPSVEDARTEYARCVAEMTATGHSESFPLWLSALPEEFHLVSLERHRAEPNKTSEKYLHELHKRLRKEVESVKRLYLDTNHWIRLLNVTLNRSKPGDGAYMPALEKLRLLRLQGKLICPLSFPIFHELMKQADSNTRRRTAGMIDELSGGVCIQPHNQIERVELKRQILRAVLGRDSPDVGEWVWTKASAVCGEWLVRPESEKLPLADVVALQKVMIDEMWNLPLAALAEFPWGLSSDGFEAAAKDCNNVAEEYRARGATFEQVLAEQKVGFFRKLLSDELENMGKEVQRQFPAECAEYQARGGRMEKPDPFALASIQIKAAVFASFIVSTRTKEILPNDLIDALHASVALPHFDAVCLDRGMAHRLTSPPLQFGKIYQTPIFSSPSEILSWLDSL